MSTFLASTVADSPNSSLYPSQSSSLRLSDSVSHILSGLNRPPLPLPQPQPITGPSFYSPKLHWLWQEAREAICTKDNKSHLSMLQAIQDEDGIFILKDWWDSIRSTAVIVTRTHLGILDVECYRVTHKKGSKTLYKRFYRAEWDCSLVELEKAAPLLSLCAGVWKADYTLGSVLEFLLLDDSPAPPSSGVSPHCTFSSRASTPSILQPSCLAPSRALTPGVVAPSHISTSSSLAQRTHALQPKPRRTFVKSLHTRPSCVPQEPQEATESVAPKAKSRRDPSPPSQNKRSRLDKDATSGSDSGASCIPPLICSWLNRRCSSSPSLSLAGPIRRGHWAGKCFSFLLLLILMIISLCSAPRCNAGSLPCCNPRPRPHQPHPWQDVTQAGTHQDCTDTVSPGWPSHNGWHRHGLSATTRVDFVDGSSEWQRWRWQWW